MPQALRNGLAGYLLLDSGELVQVLSSGCADDMISVDLAELTPAQASIVRYQQQFHVWLRQPDGLVGYRYSERRCAPREPPLLETVGRGFHGWLRLLALDGATIYAQGSMDNVLAAGPAALRSIFILLERWGPPDVVPPPAAGELPQAISPMQAAVHRANAAGARQELLARGWATHQMLRLLTADQVVRLYEWSLLAEQEAQRARWAQAAAGNRLPLETHAAYERAVANVTRMTAPRRPARRARKPKAKPLDVPAAGRRIRVRMQREGDQ